MATAQEKKDIGELRGDVNALKTNVAYIEKNQAVMQLDISYIKKSAEKMEDFVDANRSGIRTASLLDNKIITVFLVGLVGAGLYVVGKVGL